MIDLVLRPLLSVLSYKMMTVKGTTITEITVTTTPMNDAVNQPEQSVGRTVR